MKRVEKRTVADKVLDATDRMPGWLKVSTGAALAGCVFGAPVIAGALAFVGAAYIVSEVLKDDADEAVKDEDDD